MMLIGNPAFCASHQTTKIDLEHLEITITLASSAAQLSISVLLGFSSRLWWFQRIMAVNHHNEIFS
jgi:hypothetical protein